MLTVVVILVVVLLFSGPYGYVNDWHPVAYGAPGLLGLVLLVLLLLLLTGHLHSNVRIP